MNDQLAGILDAASVERIASGFQFTEGPLWDPRGFLYFVDIWPSRLYRLQPGGLPELVRENTGHGDGVTFDLQGNLIMCEMQPRRVTRMGPDGQITVLAERFEGKRFNAPNDVICKSDGSLYFTDPGLRLALSERELPYGGVYRIGTDGSIKLVVDCEYPNGLAFSADEGKLYVANTRWTQYIHEIALDAGGDMLRRRIFADMSNEGNEKFPKDGFPDGMKIDSQGRIYCTGTGGIWVFAPDGTRLGVIRTPEVAANLAFGGPDLRTLYITATTSVYALQVKAPGLPHPWYARQR
jgi:gluconolactonase